MALGTKRVGHRIEDLVDFDLGLSEQVAKNL